MYNLKNFYYLCHCTRSFERLRVAKSEKGIGCKSRTMPVAVSSISRARNWGWSLSLPLVKTGKARPTEQVRRPACAYVDFMPAGLRVRIKTMFLAVVPILRRPSSLRSLLHYICASNARGGLSARIAVLSLKQTFLELSYPIRHCPKDTTLLFCLTLKTKCLWKDFLHFWQLRWWA